MAKYVDLPNLKENLTNFLNKKINPIYAKKTEIPSNVSELNNDKSYQTAEEVGKAVTDGVAKIVAGAPEDFDTLKEMSDWISSHETSAAAMNSAISDNSVAIANHTSNSDIHVTKAEKTKWNKLDSDLKDGTIIVAEATKATQDAQGNVIDTTYAKKTEVPQETIVDDALSSTSVNPVQNKTVKAEFDKLNSNLDGLGYGENGAKNLFEDEIKWMENITITRGTKSVSDGKITLTATSDDCYTDHYGNDWKNNGIKTIPCKPNTTYTFSWEYEGDSEGNIYIFENGSTNNMRDTINKAHKLSITTSADAEYLTVRVGVRNSGASITYWNFQIEEGDTATPYKPYIPSVKMLAEENSQQSIEAMDLKMLGWSVPKECPIQNEVNGNQFVQKVGRVALGSLNWTYDSSNGQFYSDVYSTLPSANEWNKNVYSLKYTMSIITIGLSDKSVGIYGGRIYIKDSSYTDVSAFKQAMQGQYLYYELATPITKTIDGNEAISQLKNDLSNLKDGTTPVAKAVADEDGNNIKSTYAKKTELDAKANIADPVFTGSFSQNRKSGSTIGTNSHAEGNNTTASGDNSHAEGNGATAKGYNSHAEGDSYAIGDFSHAEGNASKAEGDKSHAEGTRSWGLGNNSHAEGYQTTASGSSSHSEGSSTNRIDDITTDFSEEISISDIITLRKSNKFSLAHGYGSHVEGINSLALGRSSHAEGENTIASDTCSHAEGINTTASGNISHAEGNFTEASGLNSHAEGGGTVASGMQSHAEGKSTTASGDHSHAEGYSTTASGRCSHAEGDITIAAGDYQHVQGKYNVEDTTSAFIIGNGTDTSARSNAFSVKFNGVVKAASTITASTTADYAEFFEWLDENPNNEDRVGYFVTLDGNRIKIASDNDDYILGIVSGEPFVLGNGDCDTWNGMYLHDEFRRTIYEPAPKVEEVEIKEEREETYIDEETGEEKTRTVEVVVGHEFKEVEGEFDGIRPKLNPEYDNTQQYISRFDRKEWSPVGMLGVLAVRHDGTAKVNGYVTVNKDGIATACDRSIENSYRVIKANTDSVVEVIFK